MERSARDDEASLANGLDPCAPGPRQLTALMRLLHDSAEEAKRAKPSSPSDCTPGHLSSKFGHSVV